MCTLSCKFVYLCKNVNKRALFDFYGIRIYKFTVLLSNRIVHCWEHFGKIRIWKSCKYLIIYNNSHSYYAYQSAGFIFIALECMTRSRLTIRNGPTDKQIILTTALLINLWIVHVFYTIIVLRNYFLFVRFLSITFICIFHMW